MPEWLLVVLIGVLSAMAAVSGYIIMRAKREWEAERAVERSIERSIELDAKAAEPPAPPPSVAAPAVPQWDTYSAFRAEVGEKPQRAPYAPGKKKGLTPKGLIGMSKRDLFHLKEQAIRLFEAVYKDGAGFTDSDVKMLGDLTASVEALEDAIDAREEPDVVAEFRNGAGTVTQQFIDPPDRSWVTMETIGGWRKPRRCLVCGDELGPWQPVAGRKPDWRVAGYCTKACADLWVRLPNESLLPTPPSRDGAVRTPRPQRHWVDGCPGCAREQADNNNQKENR